MATTEDRCRCSHSKGAHDVRVDHACALCFCSTYRPASIAAPPLTEPAGDVPPARRQHALR
ncbi:MAG: hypothetical protein ACRDHX_09805 [Chloroflexota bacterium]